MIFFKLLIILFSFSTYPSAPFFDTSNQSENNSHIMFQYKSLLGFKSSLPRPTVESNVNSFLSRIIIGTSIIDIAGSLLSNTPHLQFLK